MAAFHSTSGKGSRPYIEDMGKRAKNPCIDICKIDKHSGFCRGGLRSKREIKDWKELSKKERRAVIEDLPRRSVSVS